MGNTSSLLALGLLASVAVSIANSEYSSENNDKKDVSAASSDSTPLSPDERAILRRVVQTRRVIYPGYGGFGYGGVGYGGIGYGGIGYGGLGYGGLGYGGIFDEDKENSQTADLEGDEYQSQPNSDTDDSNAEADSLTPDERAILRRIVRTRRVIYPGYFDEQMGDNSDADVADDKLGEEDATSDTTKIVLRLPRRVILRLISRYGQRSNQAGEASVIRGSFQRRRANRRRLPIMLVRLPARLSADEDAIPQQ